MEPIELALRDFPRPQDLGWIDFDATHEKKLPFPEAEKLPARLRDVLYFLNSSCVLQFLERLTGISGLIPDPYFTGGGLHQIERGGHLGIHADFNRYERLSLDRRLNLLLYLNSDWQDEYGGHLELWDRTMTNCVKRVSPIFNRCVVFSTTDFAYHGHPSLLQLGSSRKSVATYYYTNGRPEEEQSVAHSTLFQGRPGVAPPPRSLTRSLKRAVRAVLPPILTEAYYALRARRSKRG